MSKYIIDLCMELNALTTMDIQFVPARNARREIAILREEETLKTLQLMPHYRKNWTPPKEEDLKLKWTLNYQPLGVWKKHSAGLAAKLLYIIEKEIRRVDLEYSSRILGRDLAHTLKREIIQLLGVEKEEIKIVSNQSNYQTVSYNPPGALSPIIFAALANLSMCRLAYNGLKKTVPVKEIKKLKPLVKKILKAEQQITKLFKEK